MKDLTRKAFSVTASTLSARKLGLLAIEKYGLHKSSSCKLFRTGINHTYLMFAKERNYVLQSGIVHMDIWYDNMSITDNREITLFDFDFCGNGYYILDVAYFCKQLFHIESDKEEYEKKARSFLNGYQSVRNMSKEELRLIPHAGAAVWIFYLGVQCRRFDWSNIFLTENYLQVYVGKMKAWIEYDK